MRSTPEFSLKPSPFSLEGPSFPTSPLFRGRVFWGSLLNDLTQSYNVDRFNRYLPLLCSPLIQAYLIAGELYLGGPRSMHLETTPRYLGAGPLCRLYSDIAETF